MMRLRIRMRMADEDFLVLRWSRMRMRMTSMWTWNTAVLHMCYHRQRSLPVRSGWRQGRVRRGRPLLSRRVSRVSRVCPGSPRCLFT